MLLEEIGYTAHSFANNEDRMSFNNILAISQKSEASSRHCVNSVEIFQ